MVENIIPNNLTLKIKTEIIELLGNLKIASKSESGYYFGMAKHGINTGGIIFFVLFLLKLRFLNLSTSEINIFG